MADINCAVCGKELKVFSFGGKVMLKDGYLCSDCCKKAGYNPLTWTGNLKTTVREIENKINGTCDSEKAGVHKKEKFVATSIIGNRLMLDEEHECWTIRNIFGIQNSEVYSFKDIISYELLENEKTVVQGGRGAALVGGAFFGLEGAVLGGVLGKKKVREKCTSLKVKITVNNLSSPAQYIEFINGSCYKESTVYRGFVNQAQEIISALDVICSRNK